jgi:hypothetical protein
VTAGLAVAMVVAMLTACGGSDGARTFHAGAVTVIDESGLVTGVSLPDPPPSPPDLPTTAAGRSLTQLDVAWGGSTCVTAWTVRLRGNALLMTIEPGPASSGCQGTQAAWAVELQLNVAIDATNVDVTLQGG